MQNQGKSQSVNATKRAQNSVRLPVFQKVDNQAIVPTATRILVSIDESENSHRVLQYVGSLLGRTPDIVVTLFHVLKPMPRWLLEHGGSENPEAEAQLSMQLRHEQEAWSGRNGNASAVSS